MCPNFADRMANSVDYSLISLIWVRPVCLKTVAISEQNLSHLTTKPTKWPLCPAKTTRLIRVFAVRMKKHGVFSYPLSSQWRLWPDWADAQADLSLRWAHISFCWFFHAAAHLTLHSTLLFCFKPSFFCMKPSNLYQNYQFKSTSEGFLKFAYFTEGL